ncbi:MAG: FAD-dependent oxidoreductase [Solirubrobacterales bacterium]
MSEIRLTIDGREVTGSKGQTILELAKVCGIAIPTLCYDERVKVYGACGLCVVEVEGNKKLVRACANEITEGMVVYTNNERVRDSRKTTLEFLLSDHVGDCRPPCLKACPANTDCQGYVGLIANGQHREAVALIKEKLPLPASIGRVCPHPCEDACRRKLVEEPVAIAYLKGFAGDFDLASGDPYMPAVKPATGKRVAMIGAGPASLTAAYYLACEGHAVTIYEAMPKAGGMLRYGIPQYRLPKEILDQEIELICKTGVTILTGMRVGQDISLDELIAQNDSVFIGIGAWQASEMGCKGEDLPGVLGGIDFLREVALNKTAPLGDRVAVVGGGNTAMDAARTAVRLGAKQVMVLYRRTRGEMPAEDIEVEEAMEEGVEFHFLMAPLEIIAENGKITGIKMQRMQLGEPDASGRRRPVPVEGADEIIPVDTVISAIGQKVNPAGLEGVAISKWGSIDASDDILMTNIPGVFAGGDGVTGPGIAIEAIAQGKRAAEAMARYLDGQAMESRQPFVVERTGLTAEDFAPVPKAVRIKMPHVSPVERRANFAEVNLGFEEAAAVREAQRCLECGCADYFECQLIAYANEYNANPARVQGAHHQERFTETHPMMQRDSDKCILCGLCVRICDEVMGVAALGLVDRGFESMVKPEFNLPLKETGCIACGQCVSVCPTGALVEHLSTAKNVPLETVQTATRCAFCGMACEQVVHTRGDRIVKAVPTTAGLLCSKGRFAFESVSEARITKPMVRKDGKLTETTWEEAIRSAADAAQTLKNRNDGEGMAVTIPAAFTMEEAAAACGFGHKVLETDNVACFGRNAGRILRKVFGDAGSTASFEEMMAADLVLLVGSMNESEVSAAAIRKAVNQGAGLMVISPEATLVDDIAEVRIQADENTTVLKEILAALLQSGWINETFVQRRTVGLDGLRAALADVVPGDAAQRIAERYASAGKAVIVIDGSLVTAAGTQMLANIALVTGKVGVAGSGIIIVAQGANSAGLPQAGVTLCTKMVTEKIRSGAIKGLFIFGEDPVGAGLLAAKDIQGTEMLVVAAPFMNATAELAQIVLPASLPFETAGSYTSADNRTLPVHQVVPPAAGEDNLNVIRTLAAAMGSDAGSLAADVKPVPQSRYMDAFATADGKARLGLHDKNVIFAAWPETDPMLMKFQTRLIREGLKGK